MSRRSQQRQRRNTPTPAQLIERAATPRGNSSMPMVPPGAAYRPIQPPPPPAFPAGYAPYNANSRPGATPGGGMTGDNSASITAYQPQVGPVVWPFVFPPGDPLRPMPGVGPRQYDFPVGVNITTQTRAGESVSFSTLRNLAELYEGVQLCEAAIFRIARRLELQVAPRPEIVPEGEDISANKWREPARYMEDWFEEGPDRRGDLRRWLIAVMRDLMEIDAVGLYHYRTRGGGLRKLQPIAGDTLMTLHAADGSEPDPPAPAFQQIVKGAPGPLFTTDDLDYLIWTGRTDSHYGLPPVQRILMRVNQALRKENYDLRRFTDGATPEGIVETDRAELFNWTPTQVQAAEMMFNSVLAGNDALRVRTKFLQPGFHFQNTKQQDIATPFDEYLLNITVAAFGLTLDELGFTGTSNRSTGQTQEAVVYRNAVRPWTDYVRRYLTTSVIRRYDGTPIALKNATISRPGSATKSAKGVWDARYVVRWHGIEEPEAFNSKVAAYVQLVKGGIVGPTQAKRLLNIPIEPNEPVVPAFVAVPGGPQSIVFPADLEAQRDLMNKANEEQLKAKVASSQQVKQAMESGQGMGGAPGMPGGAPGAPGGNPLAAQALAAGKPAAAAQAANGGVPPSQGKGMGTPQLAAQQQVGAKLASAAQEPHKPLPIAKRHTAGDDDDDGSEHEQDDNEEERGFVDAYANRVSGAARWSDDRDADAATGANDWADTAGQREVGGRRWEPARAAASAGGVGFDELGRADDGYGPRAADRRTGVTPRSGADRSGRDGGAPIRGASGEVRQAGLRGEVDRRAGQERGGEAVGGGEDFSRLPAAAARRVPGDVSASGRDDHRESSRRDDDLGDVRDAGGAISERRAGELQRDAAGGARGVGTRRGSEEAEPPSSSEEAGVEAIGEEWRRYRERALKAVKRGLQSPDFVSHVLPREEHRWVASRLVSATTPDEVRAIFQAAREGAFTVTPEPTPVTEPAPVVIPSPVSPTADDPISLLASALAARLDALTETRMREMRTLVLDAIGQE